MANVFQVSEWSGATGGPPAEVILRLHPTPVTTTYPVLQRGNLSITELDGSAIVVRAEEALIVAFVLLLWVAAIALFFNRWGKISTEHLCQEVVYHTIVEGHSLLISHVDIFRTVQDNMALIPESPPRRSRSAADLPALTTPSDHVPTTSRSSRAASLHTVDLRVCAPSPRASRAASLHSTLDIPTVQVHVRGSNANINRPRSPRRLTITNV
ncbi:unnamed protein product [Leptosia nina]|uniref:Fibronectin type III domain-containing protein n=1 Tax=Leptosia nina TaxID=320188 RepID=A0AAV1K4C1_9NEOP